jgi:hypothetical protein
MKRKAWKGEKANDSGKEGFATVWVAMAVVATTLLLLLSLFPCTH